MGPEKRRLLFVDNLRWATIFLVVVVHAAATYGPVGAWFYYDRGATDGGTSFLLMAIVLFSQAFFLGLLFLLAGYFVPQACDRKGRQKFLSDRSRRLGVPALLFMLLIAPAMISVYRLSGTTSTAYLERYFSDPLHWDPGPLWFVIALLLFSAAYAALRPLFRPSPKKRPLTDRFLAGTAAVMIISTAVARGFFPRGADVWDVQLCFLPQFIVLFTFGILAYRHDWLLTMERRTAARWLGIGILASLTVWPAIILGGALDGSTLTFVGGWSWQAVGLTAWEQLFGLGACLGLLVLFRDGLDRQGRWTKLFSDNSFAVYVFHAPVLIGLAMVLSSTGLPAGLKFLAAVLLGLGITLALSHFLLRRIPGLRRVL